MVDSPSLKNPESSLARELVNKADDALDAAGRMPPGDQRTNATRDARVLGNAAEMLQHFVSPVGARKK